MGVLTGYTVFEFIRTDDSTQEEHIEEEKDNSYEGETLAQYTFNDMFGRRETKKNPLLERKSIG